ncbi:MAG: hypothetical protein ACLP05_12275 [Candidatus Kryptoniota bacterium]
MSKYKVAKLSDSEMMVRRKKDAASKEKKSRTESCRFPISSRLLALFFLCHFA